jgi:hypothetical protein
VNGAVSERRGHDGDADHKKRKPAGQRVPGAMNAMFRRARPCQWRRAVRNRYANFVA